MSQVCTSCEFHRSSSFQLIMEIPQLLLEEVVDVLMCRWCEFHRCRRGEDSRAPTVALVEKSSRSQTSESLGMARGVQFLDKVVDVPVVVDDRRVVLSAQELWSSCCDDGVIFQGPAHTGAGPGAVSGTQLP